MSQPDLFGSTPQPQTLAQPEPEAVRRRMRDLLARLRQADVMPLTDRELRLWRTVVPQTTRLLGPEERASILAAFDAEVERLSRLAA